MNKAFSSGGKGFIILKTIVFNSSSMADGRWPGYRDLILSKSKEAF
jgi:hypothetical protein